MAPVSGVAAAECRLTTLGSFELRVRGKPIPHPSTLKARALLAYLALHRRTDIPRDRLIDVFWPDAEPERARDSLNTALHSIRRSLRATGLEPNEFLFANKSVVRWETDVDFDVERIERALHSADQSAAAEALADYGGDFLEGDYDQWTVAQRERAAGRYEELLARAVRATKAPDAAKKLLARNPYDESAYAALVDAEIGAGRYFSAAQIAQQCFSALEELGAKPSADFIARYRQLQRAAAVAPTVVDVPFVGRDGEIGELLQVLDGGRNAAALAIVEGEPGIGKTALLERIVKLASQRGRNVVSLKAIANDARPFALWPSLYASLAGEEFAAFLARTQASAAAELGAALAARFPPDTLVAIDDVQYLSGDALGTLAAIARHAASSGAYVVLVATRPEGLPQLIERIGETGYSLVRVSPLSDTDVEHAVALAGVEFDAATAESFRRRARGHPLYVKGLLEQLLRTGALQRQGKHWRVASAHADLRLPPSLRRLLEARIRARGAQAVSVACALALEPAATPPEIAGACDLTELEVLDALDDLLGYHVIVEPQAGPRRYAFAHDLVAETARTLLPAARRARMHARFAELLFECDLREAAVRSAVHFEAAEMFAQAASAYLQGAQESGELQAPHATLERTRAGLRCAEQLAASAEVEALISRLLQYQSFGHRLLWELQKYMEDAEQAVEHARAAGDLRCLADALTVLKSAINVVSMDCGRAVSVARELAAVGAQLNDDDLVVHGLIDEGHAYRITFDSANADRVLRQAFEVAVRSGLPHLTVKAGIQLLSLQAVWWRFTDADATVAVVVESLPRVDWAFRAHAWLALAMLSIELERHAQAQTYLDGVARIVEGSPLKRAAAVLNAPRPEIAIRIDYFQAVLDSACGAWNRGLQAFGTHAAMYENLLHEGRYRELFNGARIDLLLGRDGEGDVEQAFLALPARDAIWDPETGYQPAHAPIVLHARVHARKALPDAAELLAEALEFLDQEQARVPMGTDVAYLRLCEAASEAGAYALADRARRSGESLRRRKLEAAEILETSR